MFLRVIFSNKIGDLCLIINVMMEYRFVEYCGDFNSEIFSRYSILTDWNTFINRFTTQLNS